MTYDFASLSNEELNVKVAEFMKQSRNIIKSAVKSVGLDSSYVDEVAIELANKYANGKLQFDSTKGVKEEGYIYRIARNAAINIKRNNTRLGQTISINDETEFSPHEEEVSTEGKSGFEAEDELFVITEVLRRMAKEYDHDYMEIFVRSCLNREDYRVLAAEYHKNPSTVVSKRSRMYKRVAEIKKEIDREENNGRFIKCNNSISFLKPYLSQLDDRCAA